MQSESYFTIIPSPLGKIFLARNEQGLTHIHFQEGKGGPLAPEAIWQRDDNAFTDASGQLAAYFAGELRRFDLLLAPQGTPFQLTVWQALEKIPYSQTLSYGQLAAEIGRPAASRAVGAANGRNPLPVVIPCHRVIGSNGALTGYGGGLKIKQALLSLEQEGHMEVPRQLPLLG